jgi:hypothetical protein
MVDEVNPGGGGGGDWRPHPSDGATEMRIRWTSFLQEHPSLDDAASWFKEYGYSIARIENAMEMGAVYLRDELGEVARRDSARRRWRWRL